MEKTRREQGKGQKMMEARVSIGLWEWMKSSDGKNSL
jgi:hypothetical protein